MKVRKFLILRKTKGSVTVEACIALPVFLVFFLMFLTVIKIACIHMSLDLAVSEAAKQLATNAYPLSFLNEMEEIIAEKYENSSMSPFKEVAGGHLYGSLEDSPPGILENILTGGISLGNIHSSLSTIQQNGRESIKSSIGALVSEMGEEAYWTLKGQGKYTIAKAVLDPLIDEALIDKNNITLLFVEFPQGGKEYEETLRRSQENKKELTPEKDFGIDDVVLQVEYSYKIPLTIFSERTLHFRHTAIEKGWLHGGNGVYTSKEEGIKLEDLVKNQKTVYITRTGEKYHRGNCRYLRLSKIPVKLNEEMMRQYSPCKVCRP